MRLGRDGRLRLLVQHLRSEQFQKLNAERNAPEIKTMSRTQLPEVVVSPMLREASTSARLQCGPRPPVADASVEV
jgi:hypothetical protein